jgi:RimJ/RimL family protein N-acetyltransferase
MITLTQINWKDRNAFHGLLIGERGQRRKGFAAAAIVALLRYAFEELGLRRLDTTIVEYNIASLKLHLDRCGWINEGRKESAVFRKKRYWANVILGMTSEQYSACLETERFNDFI